MHLGRQFILSSKDISRHPRHGQRLSQRPTRRGLKVKCGRKLKPLVGNEYIGMIQIHACVHMFLFMPTFHNINMISFFYHHISCFCCFFLSCLFWCKKGRDLWEGVATLVISLSLGLNLFPTFSAEWPGAERLNFSTSSTVLHSTSGHETCI